MKCWGGLVRTVPILPYFTHTPLHMFLEEWILLFAYSPKRMFDGVAMYMVTLKREELVRTGSVVLHDHYFANLGGDGKPGGTVLDSIKDWFGSYEQWEAEFKRTGNALGGGSGWVILAYNQHTKEIHNYWSWDHMHNAPMSRPLLVLDMYKHAYHMDYGAAAAKYVDAFMQNVNWEEVNRRVEAAMKSS